MTDDDIDLQMIREFSVLGRLLFPSSRSDRAERIRVGILTEKRKDQPFYDTGLTYAEAYRKCYGRSIEMRRTPRHEPDPDTE